MPTPQGSKSKNPKSQPRERRSRSRNTTPLSSGTESSSIPPPLPPTGESAYLLTPLSSLLVPPNISIESLIDKYGSNAATPPSAASLNSLHDDIMSQVLGHVTARGQVCDRSMRELAKKRKERIEAEREREERERMEEERKKREVKKLIGKKRERDEMEDESRPLTVGAHGLARQDGVDVHKEPIPSSPSAPTATSATVMDTAASPSASSEASHQPPPAQPIAHYQSFGDDPTQFDDPTIYDIRDTTADMTDDEKKAILCVADYPRDDLHDLTPGTPPDMDFSNAKPANQVAYTTFQTYVEPYVRPLTEEDSAFLKERGDRVEPFLMPARGSMPYREVWAREDGLNPRDPVDFHLPANEPRGSIEDMNDEIAATEEVSTGPLLARLLGAFRHEPNTSTNDSNDTGLLNGDTTMTNGETTAGDQEPESAIANHSTAEDSGAFRPATYFPELAGSTSARSAAYGSRNFASMEQRMLQELRYHGFITPEASPDYDGHYDDEVAARLRYLQSELRAVASENGARKARVLELTEEHMANQEYATIADDQDSQINTAYLKRNRTMSKPKKGAGKPRPGAGGGAGGVAVSRNAVSEGVRKLMDLRLQWKELIGPVVDFGQLGIPKETVFGRQDMERLRKTEGEVGEGEGE